MKPIATIGALCCLASILTLASACHRHRRDARYVQPDLAPGAAPADPAPADPAPGAGPTGGSGAVPGNVDGSGGLTGAAPTGDPPPPVAAPPPPPAEKPRRGPSAADIGAAVAVGVGAALQSVPKQNAGRSVKSSTTSLCYDHDCNGSRTGRKCFGDRGAYCKSLCAESNCVARMACKSECR